MKTPIYSNDILNQFRVVKRKDNRYAIQLGPNQYLHWIEAQDNCPVMINNPNITFAKFVFKEEAQAMIVFLRKLWNTDSNIRSQADPSAPVKFEVDLKSREEE
jgi:hypothetical protein